MKRIAMVIACVALAACASPKWYHRTATDVDFHRDSAACEASAGATYPVAMTALGGGHQAPTRIDCNTYGNTTNCRSQPGAYTPPPQIDVNMVARARLHESCLLGKGYSRSSNAAMGGEGGSDSAPVTRHSLTACRDYDRAARKGTWQEQQDEKRKIAALSLSESDCRSMIANADR
jgi:hypothetical protein